MTGVLSSVRAVNIWPVVRAFSSSAKRNARFRPGGGGTGTTTPPPLKELGRLVPEKKMADGTYAPGQLFIHKLFAYRGIVICSFKCRVHNKPTTTAKGELITKTDIEPHYQVLIHRGDWRFMHFPVDITSYLGEAGARGEKLLTVINGMDCVSQEEMIPFASAETKPIDHDLFDRIFEVHAETSDEKDVQFAIRKELMPNYLASQQSWLSPQEVYRETTDGIMVTVTTFYLGANVIAGQQKHCWRYVIRLENLGDSAVILRERAMKVFSLNNMQQVSGHGVIGTNPRLSPQEPAFQFSSTVDLPQPKGAHMWGKFKMERENGSCFDVTIPTIVLESHAEHSSQQTETRLH